MEKYQKLLPFSASIGKTGELEIAGHNVRELAEKWGTPLYIYDGITLKEKIDSLYKLGAEEYKGKFDITYASKAYLSLGFARHLASLGVGVDVVSLGEMKIAGMAGFPPERVHLHGNNKSEEELEFALDWGAFSIVVDSLEELAFLEELAARKKKKMQIWLRIAPGVDVDTHPYLQTGHTASKFGIPIPDGQAVRAIEWAKGSEWLNLIGLHTHIGSQISDAKPYQRAVRMLLKIAAEADFVPQQISTGGGWGVLYRPEDKETKERDWVAMVADALHEECAALGYPLPQLVLEPGRWLTAQAGLAVYRVGFQKKSREGIHVVAVDGGMADNPRPAMYQAVYCALVVERPMAKPIQKVNLVGKYCETGDVLIAGVELPEVKRGDLIAMPSAGAYQLSMASNYNMAARPAVLWLEPGSVELLQKREDPSDAGWWVDAQ